MKKSFKFLIFAFLIVPCIFLSSCGVLTVKGKTFNYSKVEIDWGIATKDDKNALFAEFQVENEPELLNVLKTRNGRNSRYTTFGTDGKYITKNEENEILDRGYYKQEESVITLAETDEGLSDPKAYTLQANEKGYIVTIVLNSDKQIYAKYEYVEQE